jgi:hypothetical protein
MTINENILYMKVVTNENTLYMKIVTQAFQFGIESYIGAAQWV